MSYEYIDDNGNMLSIKEAPFFEHGPRVGVDMDTSRMTGWKLLVKPEDAPAPATALLEKAGIEPIDPAEPDASATPERLALYWLYQWHGLRKAQEERKAAEDAQVREWRQATEGTTGEHVTDPDRQAYRSERAFWEKHLGVREEKPAPRVLNYGDPDPERGTQWKDVDDDVWSFRKSDGWWAANGRGTQVGWASKWDRISSKYFPMTEVTE